jgi:hypothetical protein
MHWQSVLIQNFASVVAVMVTLLYGISIVRVWFDNSKVTLMVPVALTFLLMEQRCGPEVWITQCVLGIFEKVDNFNNMTSNLKYFALAFAQLEIG